MSRSVFQRGTVLVWLLWFGGFHVAQLATADVPGQVRWDARLQARWLERSLTDADAQRAQGVFPEGELFTWEFYGLALQNIAETTRAPEDVARANREVRRLLPKVDAALNHPPFGAMRHWRLRGGVCWFSGQNLLRGRLVALGGGTPEDIQRFHNDSQILAEAFAASQTGALESYPGLTWPVDSLFGFASLQVHDRLYGTAYARTFSHYRRALDEARDARTGLPASMLHLDGRPRDVPRGCALSWSLAVLPALDEKWAADQWARYLRTFGRCAGGLCLFREYPAGSRRAADVDSGPMAFGMGMSASGFALAAARANGDAATVGALERTGELLGIGGISWWGKRYLGGGLKTLDIFGLWAQTVPFSGDRPSSGAPWVTLGMALAWGSVALVQAWCLRRAWRQREPATARERILLAACVAAVLVHLVSPAVPALWVPVAWAAIAALPKARTEVSCAVQT